MKLKHENERLQQEIDETHEAAKAAKSNETKGDER
jgi:outer membrane murein-binding lipoprotein Lpp